MPKRTIRKNNRKAGRPAFFDNSMRRYDVMLDANTVSLLRKLGDGNLSLGIRLAAKSLTESPHA